jgi:hypothetical protein
MNMWSPTPAVLPWMHTSWRKPLFFEDDNYVELDFAKELIEMYYRRTTFILPNNELALLNTWLQQDPFGYGLIVCENLCHLTILLRFDRPGVMLNPDLSSGYTVNIPQAVQHIIKQTESLSDELAPLKYIKRSCDINFAWGIWQGAIGLFHFLYIMKTLGPIASRLSKSGCQVRFKISRYGLRSYGMEFISETWFFEVNSQTLEDIQSVSGQATCQYAPFLTLLS